MRTNRYWAELFVVLLAIELSGCLNEPKQAPAVTPIDSAVIQRTTKFRLSLSGVSEWLRQSKHNSDVMKHHGYGEVIGLANYSVLRWNLGSLSADTADQWSSDPTPPTYREDMIRGSESYTLRATIGTDNSITGQLTTTYANWAKNHWGSVYNDENHSTSIRFQSIPLVSQSGDTLVFSSSGATLRSLISEVGSSRGNLVSDPDHATTATFQNFDWDSLPNPFITIMLHH